MTKLDIMLIFEHQNFYPFIHQFYNYHFSHEYKFFVKQNLQLKMTSIQILLQLRLHSNLISVSRLQPYFYFYFN